MPAFYKTGLRPELEREILRDFRVLAAEFIPPKNVTDTEWLLHAHQNGVPTRIVEWMANPLAALFHAVESMSTASHGKVWVFNPWAFNEMTAGVGYVPMLDSELASNYMVNLTDPTAFPVPRAENPMAFRPYHNLKAYNMQGVNYTLHGFMMDAIELTRPLLKRNPGFINFLLIDADRKKAILKELYGLNVTRSALMPTLTNLVRTLNYRYSKDYIQTEI